MGENGTFFGFFFVALFFSHSLSVVSESQEGRRPDGHKGHVGQVGGVPGFVHDLVCHGLGDAVAKALPVRAVQRAVEEAAQLPPQHSATNEGGHDGRHRQEHAEGGGHGQLIRYVVPRERPPARLAIGVHVDKSAPTT